MPIHIHTYMHINYFIGNVKPNFEVAVLESDIVFGREEWKNE